MEQGKVNENYYLEQSRISGIHFYFQPDKEETWSRLLAGKTDIAPELSPKDYEMIRQYRDRFYFNLYAIWHYTILLYNTTDPLFADPKVRKALSLAVDEEGPFKGPEPYIICD